MPPQCEFKFPHGIKQIREYYGDPRGVPERYWRRKILEPLDLPKPLKTGGGKRLPRLWVHHMIREPLNRVLQEIYARGLWSKLRTIACYAYRKKRGRQKMSTHSWGIAVDINARTNRLGTVGDMDLEVVEIFERHGWTWGGRWKRKDPMHFQAVSGY